MEQSEHHPLSPAGQVDQWGDLASGLRHNRSGRRRALLMLLGLVVVLAFGSALLAVLLTLLG